MNRRGFFGALLGVAAAPVLAAPPSAPLPWVRYVFPRRLFASGGFVGPAALTPGATPCELAISVDSAGLRAHLDAMAQEIGSLPVQVWRAGSGSALRTLAVESAEAEAALFDLTGEPA